MRLLAVLFLALALLPSAGAAWTQLGGGAARSAGTAAIEGPLDIVEMRAVARPGSILNFQTNLPLVHTGAGFVGIETPLAVDGLAAGGTCTPIALDDPPGAPRRGERFACPSGARPLAYDAARDLLLVCVDGGFRDRLLRGLDASTMRERWSIAPSVVASAPATLDQGDWSCVAPALDSEMGIAYTGFARDQNGHEIVAVDLDDGSILQSAHVPDALFMQPQVGAVVPGVVPEAGPPTIAPTPGDNFRPVALTRTTSGFVVAGTWGSAASGGAEAVAWLDADLTPIRGLFAGNAVGDASVSQPTRVGETANFFGSSWAASHGALAAIVLAEWLIIIDPAAEGVTRIPFDMRGPEQTRLAHTAWTAGTIVAPGGAGVVGYDSARLEEAWSWPGLPGGEVCDVLTAGESDLYVLSLVPTNASRLALSRLDLASGQELQRIPIPAAAGFGEGRACEIFAARVLPDAEGLVVVTRDGDLARLAPAREGFAPTVTLSNDYPGAGSVVEARVERAGASAVLIAWGDGAVEEARSGDILSHRYVEPGERTLRVTAVLPDGRTATTETPVHVGRERPLALSMLQRAFSRENQEVTFFVIGLGVTGGGTLFAIMLRNRRHKRLANEQRAIARLQALAARDPEAGLASLEHHREHLIRAHTSHRLDDAQFQLLDAKTVRAMRATRYRLLGPAMNELTPHVRRLLDTALEDGRISEAERDALLSALETERLSSDEKARIGGLLRAWSVEA